jgi:hypothetical protein
MSKWLHWLCAECYFAREPHRPPQTVPGISGTRCCACGLGPARIQYHDAPRHYRYCKYIHAADDAVGTGRSPARARR